MAEQKNAENMTNEEFVAALKEAQSKQEGEFASTEEALPEGSARVFFDAPKEGNSSRERG